MMIGILVISINQLEQENHYLLLLKIKDLFGVWLYEVTPSQKLFIHDFTTRFKSVQGNVPNLQINLPSVVSDEDNDTLIKLVEDDQIKDAIF